MAMSAFRRSAATETKNKGGKGGKGAWYEKMALPKGSPTPVLMLRGGYVDPNPPQSLIEIDPATGRAKPVINDFFKYRKHKRKLMGPGGKEEFRDEPCSAGNDPHNPQPCAGCSAMDQGDKSVTLQDMYLFGVLHLAPYHLHPLFDYKERVFREKQDKTMMMTYSECEGRTCNYCKVQNGQQPVVQQGEIWPPFQPNMISTTFGHRRYLELGKSHLSDLEGFDNSISSICANPQCQQQLCVDGYACPTCNNMIITMASDPRDDKEISEAVLLPYPCLTCQRSVLLKEIVSCEFCEAAGRQFQQTSLFDNVLFLFRQGEGTKSHIMMQRYQPIDVFGTQLQQMGWLRDGKTIRHLIEEIGKPYDFAEVFKPRSLADQAQKLKLAAPQALQSAYGPQAPMYGQPMQPQQQQNFMPPQQGYPQQYPQQPMPVQPQYPQQQMGYVAPGPNTAGQPAPQQGYQPYPGTPQSNAGPAPFQPTPRGNFGT